MPGKNKSRKHRVHALGVHPKISGNRIILASLVILLSVSTTVNYLLIRKNFSGGRVVKVVDGDSFDLADGRRIRLASIDAPENGRCMYPQAKNTLENLVADQRPRIDVLGKDDFGRLLANVHIGKIFANLELVEKGYARYTSSQNPRSDELKKAYAKARTSGIGIFSPLCLNTEPTYGCDIKGNFRNGRKTYHLPYCHNYEQTTVNESFGDRWFCTEEEAVKNGFIRAAGCD